MMYIWKRSDPTHLYVVRGYSNVGSINTVSDLNPILFEDYVSSNGMPNYVKVNSINYTDNSVEFTVVSNGYLYDPAIAIIF